jgi:hypothetical protein
MTDSTKQGWVRFYRWSLESTVFKNPIIWFVWSWCLLKASHATYKFPFNGMDMTIDSGQFLSGINSAIKELGTLTPQNYRTAIKYLKSTGRITVKSNNKFSIITIVKWDEYQRDNSLDNKRLTNEQQATNKPLTTYKNVKKVKNDKNTTGGVPPQEVVQIIDAFKQVNPSYQKWFANVTQRGAIDRLIKIHGLDRLLHVIAFLPKSNTIPYIPTITSPFQLEEKWADLEAGLTKLKNKSAINKPNVIFS